MPAEWGKKRPRNRGATQAKGHERRRWCANKRARSTGHCLPGVVRRKGPASPLRGQVNTLSGEEGAAPTVRWLVAQTVAST